jgi:small GTP-binding protein
MTSDDKESLKIAFLGLSNAGKTSIIKSITQEFEMLTVLKPTISIERSSLELLGKNLIFWDFGGQEKYREAYIGMPERYFDNISHAFYVVDVQDPDLLEQNITYFRATYDALRTHSPNAKMIILLHKFDPNLVLPAYKVDVKQKFIEAVAPLLAADKKPVTIYQTSIYRLLSLVTAISQPLFGSSELYTNSSDIMRSFTENYNLLFAILFTEKYLEIGSSISDRMKKIGEQAEAKDFLVEFFKQVSKTGNTPTKIAIDHSAVSCLSAVFHLQIGRKKLPFYIAIGFDDESMLEKDGLEIALSRLLENLEKLFANADLNLIVDRINAT